MQKIQLEIFSHRDQIFIYVEIKTLLVGDYVGEKTIGI